MRLGIYGGSFNPPHLDHFTIGNYLVTHYYLDSIIYVPVGNSYSKVGLIDLEYRYAMLELMIENTPNLAVSRHEDRCSLVYTYQTLDYFQKMYPNDEIYFVCGSDNLEGFNTWMHYEYILKNYKLLVIQRNDAIFKDLLLTYQEYLSSIVCCKISLLGLSSTYIRKLLLEGNYSKELLDSISPSVLEYIKEKKLYRK